MLSCAVCWLQYSTTETDFDKAGHRAPRRGPVWHQGVGTRVHVFALMRSCICIDAFMHSCVHAFMRSRIHAFMHSCVHAFMRSCIHAFMRSCLHAHTRETSLLSRKDASDAVRAMHCHVCVMGLHVHMCEDQSRSEGGGHTWVVS